MPACAAWWMHSFPPLRPSQHEMRRDGCLHVAHVAHARPLTGGVRPHPPPTENNHSHSLAHAPSPSDGPGQCVTPPACPMYTLPAHAHTPSMELIPLLLHAVGDVVELGDGRVGDEVRAFHLKSGDTVRAGSHAWGGSVAWAA